MQCCKLWFSNLVNLSYRVMCNIRLDLKIFLYSIIQKGNIGHEFHWLEFVDFKLNIVQWISARIHCVMFQTRNNKKCINTTLLLNSHLRETYRVMQYNALENRKCFLTIPKIKSANVIKIVYVTQFQILLLRRDLWY